jgi:hypothetical protein
LLEIVFVPQRMMRRASAKRSGSVPVFAPSVASNAAAPADAQMVRSRSDAPRRLKKRLSIDSDWTRPIVPQ